MVLNYLYGPEMPPEIILSPGQNADRVNHLRRLLDRAAEPVGIPDDEEYPAATEYEDAPVNRYVKGTDPKLAEKISEILAPTWALFNATSVKQVQRATEKDGDVNARMLTGGTNSGIVPLVVYYASEKPLEMLKAILKAGANPNVFSGGRQWSTPLLEAIKLGDSSKVKALLAAGADPLYKHQSPPEAGMNTVHPTALDKVRTILKTKKFPKGTTKEVFEEILADLRKATKATKTPGQQGGHVVRVRKADSPQGGRGGR